MKEKLNPEQETPKKVTQRTNYFQFILVGVTLAFGILAFLAKNIPYFPFDLTITLLIQNISFPFFKELMLILTALGNIDWGILTVIFIAIVLLSIGKNLQAVFFVISVAGTSAISLLFKALIARPRPSSDLISQLASYTKNDSFPSGHVLFFLGCYGFLFYLIFTHLKPSRVRTILLVFVALMLLSIGISRVYVGAHWFSDTLGAYLIGSAWLYCVIYLFSKYRKRND